MSEVPVTRGGSQPSRPLVFLTLCIGTTLYEVRRFAVDHPLARDGVRLRKFARRHGVRGGDRWPCPTL
jgi:hypothetical protein